MGGPDRDHQDAQKIGHHNRGIGKVQAIEKRSQKRGGDEEESQQDEETGEKKPKIRKYKNNKGEIIELLDDGQTKKTTKKVTKKPRYQDNEYR